MSAQPILIYHNPRCSKSRQALEMLRDRGVEPDVIEYLKTPPSTRDLDALCSRLGLPPQAVIRFGEAAAKQLGLSKTDARSRAEWLALIHANPILLERPIVVRGDAACIGRPPENVLSLLS